MKSVYDTYHANVPCVCRLTGFAAIVVFLGVANYIFALKTETDSITSFFLSTSRSVAQQITMGFALSLIYGGTLANHIITDPRVGPTKLGFARAANFSYEINSGGPFAHSISWIPRVNGSQVDEFVASAKQHWPDFTMYEQDPTGGRRNLTLGHEFYWPILFVVNSVSLAAVGFDSVSDHKRRQSIEYALEHDSPALTPRVVLQSVPNKTSSLLYFPAHPSNPDGSGKPEVAGLIAVSFVFEEILGSAVAVLGLEKVNVFLFDMTAAPDAQYLAAVCGTVICPYDSSYLLTDVESDLSDSHDVSVGGRIIRVLVSAPSGYVAATRSIVPLVVLLTCLLGGVAGQLLNILLIRSAQQLKRSEIELSQQRDLAMAAVQTQRLFIGTMSHELRTPLNGVMGTTEVLAADPTLVEFHREMARIANTSAKLLLSVINDILDFSKMQAGKWQPKKETFDLARCIDNVIEIMSQKAAQKKVDLASTFALPDCRIEGLPHETERVLLNYLSNALSYTSSGGVLVTASAHAIPHSSLPVGANLPQLLQSVASLHNFMPLASELHRCPIEVLTSPHNLPFVFISVHDTGEGISDSMLSQLFQPFVQADATDTRSQGGAGLGLSICREIAKYAGGAVWATSQVGVGSVFNFVFPVKFVLADAPAASTPASLLPHPLQLPALDINNIPTATCNTIHSPSPVAVRAPSSSRNLNLAYFMSRPFSFLPISSPPSDPSSPSSLPSLPLQPLLSSPSSGQSMSLSVPAPPRKRALIVERAHTANLLRKALSILGYDCQFAPSVQMAMQSVTNPDSRPSSRPTALASTALLLFPPHDSSPQALACPLLFDLVFVGADMHFQAFEAARWLAEARQQHSVSRPIASPHSSPVSVSDSPASSAHFVAPSALDSRLPSTLSSPSEQSTDNSLSPSAAASAPSVASATSARVLMTVYIHDNESMQKARSLQREVCLKPVRFEKLLERLRSPLPFLPPMNQGIRLPRSGGGGGGGEFRQFISVPQADAISATSIASLMSANSLRDASALLHTTTFHSSTLLRDESKCLSFPAVESTSVRTLISDPDNISRASRISLDSKRFYESDSSPLGISTPVPSLSAGGGAMVRARHLSSHGAPARVISPIATACPLRVLVVDDNGTNVRVALRMLQSLGYHVNQKDNVAEDGLRALEMLATLSFDLVLMDLQMPRMSGIEATAAFRTGIDGKYARNRDAQIVSLTALSPADSEKSCAAVGMVDQLTKPLTLASLQAVLQRAHARLQLSRASSPSLAFPKPMPASSLPRTASSASSSPLADSTSFTASPAASPLASSPAHAALSHDSQRFSVALVHSSSVDGASQMPLTGSTASLALDEPSSGEPENEAAAQFEMDDAAAYAHRHLRSYNASDLAAASLYSPSISMEAEQSAFNSPAITLGSNTQPFSFTPSQQFSPPNFGLLTPSLAPITASTETADEESAALPGVNSSQPATSVFPTTHAVNPLSSISDSSLPGPLPADAFGFDA